MIDEKFDYGMYTTFDVWLVKDARYILKTYVAEYARSQGSSEDEVDDKEIEATRKFNRDKYEFIENEVYMHLYDEDGYPEYDGFERLIEVIDPAKSTVNIINFIKWAYRERLPLPPVIMDIVKQKSSKNPQPTEIVTGMSEKDKMALAELPVLRKQVAELTAEKGKWDASIEAAVKIGLLFYENQLEKPVVKAKFIEMFSDMLGQGLPDSTVDKIYKNLPTEYKLRGGAPKKTTGSDYGVDIDTIIKAAVYAGSIYDTDDVKEVKSLKATFSDEGIDISSVEVLNKIIKAVKDI